MKKPTMTTVRHTPPQSLTKLLFAVGAFGISALLGQACSDDSSNPNAASGGGGSGGNVDASQGGGGSDAGTGGGGDGGTGGNDSGSGGSGGDGGNDSGSGGGGGDGGEGGAGPVCGNSSVEGTEQCDDGNAQKCDGCEGCELRKVLKLPTASTYGEFVGIGASLPTGGSCYEFWLFMLPYVGPESIQPILFSSFANGGDGAFMFHYTFATDTVTFLANSGNLIATGTLGGTNAWHHVAGCINVDGTPSTTTRLFIDGQLVGSSASAPGQPSGARTTVVLGGATYAKTGLGGKIDEVRISNVVRYTGAFTPARRFTSDADTVSLWHLDEGGGATIVDSSGNNHNGTISGTNSGAAYENDTGYRPSDCN